MSIIIKNLDVPVGCQKCKFFHKHMFGNGLDYSYSCVLGAKDFPFPWIRQMDNRASDCPIEEPKTDVLDKIRAEIFEEMLSHSGTGEEVIQAYADGLKKGLQIIDKYAESEGK